MQLCPSASVDHIAFAKRQLNERIVDLTQFELAGTIIVSEGCSKTPP
jgi:hypothetical protein